jgi:hypothetical protein
VRSKGTLLHGTTLLGDKAMTTYFAVPENEEHMRETLTTLLHPPQYGRSMEPLFGELFKVENVRFLKKAPRHWDGFVLVDNPPLRPAVLKLCRAHQVWVCENEVDFG